jgi:hypothetical protein
LVVKAKANLGGITLKSNTTTDTNYLLFADGTTGNARYRGVISYDHQVDSMKFNTAASNAVTIDSNQNVGIGTSSPAELLEIKGTEGVIRLQQTGGAYSDIRSSDFGTLYLRADPGNTAASSSMRFHVDASERMRIDSSGNVGIGTSSTTNDAKLIVVGSDGKHPTIKTNDSGANGFTMLADNYTATESQVNFGVGYSSSDLVLSRCVKPSDAAEKVYLSSQAQAACKPSAFVMDGDGGFRFLNTNTSATTAVDTAVSLSERMRIDSSGRLQVGLTNAPISGYDSKVNLVTNGGSYYGIMIKNISTSNSNAISFINSSNSATGYIEVTTSSTSYNTSSDARLKDITGEARGLEVINELNPVSYNWKVDGKADEGLIAQEVLDIVPNAVTGSEEKYYQMDYSKLVVHLVKGMKEQQAQIEALQSEINLLKGE